MEELKRRVEAEMAESATRVRFTDCDYYRAEGREDAYETMLAWIAELEAK